MTTIRLRREFRNAMIMLVVIVGVVGGSVWLWDYLHGGG